VAVPVTPDLETGVVTQLASGHDFYSSPAISPDGNLLAFVAWDHPNMPWDDTWLYLAAFDEKGQLQEPRCVAALVSCKVADSSMAEMLSTR
jgi:hypothetical protein